MDTAEKVSRYETDKVDLNEFVKITKWALATIYRVHPVYFSLLIGTSIIRQWNDIVYTYIFAKAVDELIKVAQMPGASITYLYPYIFILLGYSLFQTLINFLNAYSNMHIRTVSGYQVRKQQYKKIQSLGTQTLEIPEVNNTINRTNEYLGSLLPYTQESISFLASIVKMITTISITLSFMPLFAPLIIATSIPYLLFDKSVRKKIYKFDYDNTETRRVGSNIIKDLTSSVRLHEININNAFR